MRIGMGMSIGLHAAVFVAAAVGLPSSSLMEPDAIEAMPVELVPIDEITDLTLGSKKAEPEKAAETPPQPLPNKKAETEQPEPQEKVAKTPVKEAREPAPLPTPKKAEEAKPEKKAETDVAALKPEPAREPKPKTEKPAEALAPAPKPKQRPKPPKNIVKPKLQAKTPEKNEPEFNSDDIAALLNKRDPAGGGSPEPSSEPQTFGSVEGQAQAAMTQSEIAALQARLYQCWNPPTGVREAKDLRVQVAINLNPDGSLSAPPRVIGGGFDPLAQIAAESAVRAVQVCAPYDILPPEKYHVWRSINFTFDPSQMLGG